MGTLKFFFIATKFIMPFIMDVIKKWTFLFVMGIFQSELGERSKKILIVIVVSTFSKSHYHLKGKYPNENKSPYETS